VAGKEAPASDNPPALATMAPSLSQENRLAVAAIALAVVCWPVGVVFGHLARRRARYAGGAGAGLAVVALLIGYSFGFAAFLLLMIHLGTGGPAQPV
jgi:hypothetical protein